MQAVPGWWVDELYERVRREKAPVTLYVTEEKLFRALSGYETCDSSDTRIGVVWGFHVTMFDNWIVHR